MRDEGEIWTLRIEIKSFFSVVFFYIFKYKKKKKLNKIQ